MGLYYSGGLLLWRLCEGVGLSTADSRESIKCYLKRNPELSFVAYDGSSVVGAILCGHDGRRRFIHHLAVHPEFRRRGIGKRLVYNCLKRLSQEAIQKCHLFLFSENESAISFWKETDWTERIELTMMSKEIVLSNDSTNYRDGLFR
jgi:putative acetyltransferase